MPQTERTFKHVETTTRNPSIASTEQFLRGGESSRMSPIYSPTSSNSASSPYFERMMHHDPEEDQGLYQRKSVLTKVKEKARKLVLRNSLSLSRKRQDDDNLTPSWGVRLEDEEEEDAEYLGAPIYESELAPDEYKENARQHPRANPVISEKRVLRTAKSGEQKEDQENALTPVKSKTNPQLSTITTNPNPNPNMTTITEKLTPTNIEGSSYASSKSSNVVSKTPIAPLSSPMMQNSSPSSFPTLSRNNNINASPKSAYSMNNEKSAYHSQPLMSPRRSPTNNNGSVIDRVKGAVNSLLRNEEQQQPKYVVNKRVTPQLSNTTQEVGQETENHGKILQAN